MSRLSEHEIDDLLQRGLRSIPAPEPAAEFDDRVRAGLRRRPPIWQLFWDAMRPALPPAALSLAVTLAALMVMGSPTAGVVPIGAAQTAGTIAHLPALREAKAAAQAADRIDQAPASLCGFGNMRRAGADEPQPSPEQPPRGRKGATERRNGRTRVQA
jgi:hypothetical protein